MRLLAPELYVCNCAKREEVTDILGLRGESGLAEGVRRGKLGLIRIAYWVQVWIGNGPAKDGLEARATTAKMAVVRLRV